MEYVMSKDLPRSLQRLGLYGGQAQRASEKVLKIIGAIRAGLDKPFHGVTVTRQGESRIKGCVKYDLGSGYRLKSLGVSSLCAGRLARGSECKSHTMKG